MLVGAYGSLGERMVRRSLAWQMIAGVGYILLGLGIGTQLGLAAGLFYMVHHILVMGSLLLSSGAIERAYLTHQFLGLSGLMRREQRLAVVVALAMMSLVGFPPSSGFFGKVGIARAAADLDGAWVWLVLGVLVVASIGTLLSMTKLWGDVFWGPPLEESPSRGKGHTDLPPVDAETRMQKRSLAPAGALAEGLLDVTAYVEAVTAP
jgi:multicomponent Na+:H+ antiporter subunit D